MHNKYRITYNSKYQQFMVTKPCGKEFVFKEPEGGLHFLDTTCSERDEDQDHGQEHTFMVNTVKDNRRNFTNNDYLRAIRARELQETIGQQSDKDFIKILRQAASQTAQLPHGMSSLPTAFLDLMSGHSRAKQHNGALLSSTHLCQSI